MFDSKAKLVPVVTVSALLGWALIAKEAGDDPANNVHRGYVSPITNSAFFGLSPDESTMPTLMLSPVADELNLTPRQVEKLKSIYEPIARENIPLMTRLHSHASAEGFQVRARLRAELADRSARLDAEMLGVLDSAQRARLRQVWLQVRDPSALVTASWALGQLNLREPQRDKFKMIVALLWAKEAKFKEEHRADARRTIETRQAIQNERERALEKMIAVLEPEQVVTLAELLGKPYDVARLRWSNRMWLTPVPWWHGVKQEGGGG